MHYFLQVELLVTYEGQRFVVNDLKLLMDQFHRAEFTGTWRRLFSRVKKHIIWGVLKSVTGMQVMNDLQFPSLFILLLMVILYIYNPAVFLCTRVCYLYLPLQIYENIIKQTVRTPPPPNKNNRVYTRRNKRPNC